MRERPDNELEILADELLEELVAAGMTVLGPYPLCRECQRVNGGLVAVRHRQVHLRVNGREACVDRKMADIITALWTADCDTRGCCEDSKGRAYVVPEAPSRAEEALAGAGIDVSNEHGVLYFRTP